MSPLDWWVLIGTIGIIVVYGAWKSRGIHSTEAYLRGDGQLRWPTIGLSIMATQASAITFLSVPGQAYEHGMGFVQFYLGLPIAMVIIAVWIVPRYYKLRVFTAYEFLESRFDLNARLLGATLFLIQRGLSAGITIYAPAVILSSVLGWSLNLTIVIIGAVVILYTVSGGTKAVSQTQKQQMIVIMVGMVIAAVVIVSRLPSGVGVGDAFEIGGALGRVNVIDFEFDLSKRYNFWSGITGGLFLALAYFGTDQSQVQRYLGGRSITESRLGLLFNGILKIPMQFLILGIGVMVLVFYQFTAPPLFFNGPALAKVYETPYAAEMADAQQDWDQAYGQRMEAATRLAAALDSDDQARIAAAKAELAASAKVTDAIRTRAKAIIAKATPEAEQKDADYIFVTFVLAYLPAGLIGLLIAVILSAAMSSTASELNALGSTLTMDIYKRAIRPGKSDEHYLLVSKGFTVFVGLLAVAFAAFASLVDNMIQAVNILGSLFYGTILGMFLVAFFIRFVKARAVVLAALISEGVVVTVAATTEVGFLWYNVIGCAAVCLISMGLQTVLPTRAKA